jgi:hypothetical protein
MCSCHILIKLEFSLQILKNTQLSNLTEICVMGADFYHADGQTDMRNLIVAFRNFASAPKMLIFKNVTNEMQISR